MAVDEVTLPGVGHIPILEDSQLVASALRDHLNKVGTKPD